MTCVRRLTILMVGIAAVCAFAAPRAMSAAPPSCSPLEPQSVTGAHFIVNYSDDPTTNGHISQSQAGTILAAAERSYATYTGDGFPAPAVSGSGKTELNIYDLSSWKLSAYYCNGSVDIDPTAVTGDLADYEIGIDVFTQVEVQVAGPGIDQWLTNGAGAWASWRALGYPGTSIADIGPFDMSLDCDSAYDKENCSATGYENLGESRWPFYEYLSEKYGPLFMVDVFNAAGAAGGDGLTGLQNAIAAKGSTLTAEYASFAAKLLSGGWTATTLNAAVIPVAGKIQTGISSGAIPTQSFGINHLATKFVEIDRGDGSNAHACYAATLTLNVKLAAGVTSQPTFYWAGGGGSAVPLTVNGSTATTTVPWDTCAWTSSGYLSLPNTSLVDGTSFVVSGTLTVDFSTPASSATPPAPVTQYGTPVSADSFSTAPTVTVFGSDTIVLANDASSLRVAVYSSGEGTLKVTLGSLSIGTMTLAGGTNAHTFTLPDGAMSALGLAKAAGLPLTLTPSSTSGTVHGTAVTRTVTIGDPPSLTAKTTKAKTKKTTAKAKPAKKAKPTAKKKPKSHK